MVSTSRWRFICPDKGYGKRGAVVGSRPFVGARQQKKPPERLQPGQEKPFTGGVVEDTWGEMMGREERQRNDEAS